MRMGWDGEACQQGKKKACRDGKFAPRGEMIRPCALLLRPSSACFGFFWWTRQRGRKQCVSISRDIGEIMALYGNPGRMLLDDRRE
jgi:hypothetical protein